MKRQSFRLPFTALATAFFLAFSFQPTPSDPSIVDPARLPRPEEDVLLRELASWTVGRPSSGLQVMTSADLDAALAPEPRQLTLFASELGVEEQRRFLQVLPFGTAMARAAERHELDGLLLAAVVETESRFSPRAVSPRGAVGLMQVLPSTAEAYGSPDLFDPHANLDVGSRYLRRLIKTYDGDLELALAAYNAGPAAVDRYGRVPPFRETRDYVKRVLARYEKHRQSVWEEPLEGAEYAIGAR